MLKTAVLVHVLVRYQLCLFMFEASLENVDKSKIEGSLGNAVQSRSRHPSKMLTRAKSRDPSETLFPCFPLLPRLVPWRRVCCSRVGPCRGRGRGGGRGRGRGLCRGSSFSPSPPPLRGGVGDVKRRHGFLELPAAKTLSPELTSGL